MKALKHIRGFTKNLQKRYIDIKLFIWYSNFKSDNELELGTGADSPNGYSHIAMEISSIFYI